MPISTSLINIFLVEFCLSKLLHSLLYVGLLIPLPNGMRIKIPCCSLFDKGKIPSVREKLRIAMIYRVFDVRCYFGHSGSNRSNKYSKIVESQPKYSLTKANLLMIFCAKNSVLSSRNKGIKDITFQSSSLYNTTVASIRISCCIIYRTSMLSIKVT